MTSDYIKLTEPARLCIHYPTCSVCGVDVDFEDCFYICPSCGTLWGDSDDGAVGELYEEWSGEEIEGEPLDHSDAAEVALYIKMMSEYRKFGELYPSLYPKPRLPEVMKKAGY